jgi:hypothetical protein
MQEQRPSSRNGATLAHRSDTEHLEFADSSTCRSCGTPFREYARRLVPKFGKLVHHESSHGYCEQCRPQWVSPPGRRKVRSSGAGDTRLPIRDDADSGLVPDPFCDDLVNGPRLDRIKLPYVVPQGKLRSIILDHLPATCRGAILRYFVQASSVFVDKWQLVSAVHASSGYERRTVQSTLSKLIREDVVQERKGSLGIAAPYVHLTMQGLWECGWDDTSVPGKKTTYRLQYPDDPAPDKVLDTVEQILANLRWVVVQDTIDCDDFVGTEDMSRCVATKQSAADSAELPNKASLQRKLGIKPRNQNKTADCFQTIQELFSTGGPPLTQDELRKKHRCRSRKPARDAFRMLWATEAHMEYQRVNGSPWGRHRGRPAQTG